MSFLPSLDPQTVQVLLEEIGIRYTETEPTHTPNKRVEAWVYFDGADYWLYLWANGGWRSQQLGAGGGSVAGSDTQVQFNDGGAFGADANLLFDKTASPPTLYLQAIGNIDGNDILIDADATNAHLGNNITLSAARGVSGGGDGGDIGVFAGDANSAGGGTGQGGGLNLSCGTGRGAAGGTANIIGGDAASGNAAGGGVFNTGGNGSGTGAGGAVNSTGGTGGATGAGGAATLAAGAGGATSGAGGSTTVSAGNASAGNSNGGNLFLSAGTKSGSGTQGEVSISNGAGLYLKSGMDTFTYAATISLDVTKNSLHKTTTVHATGNATINASGPGNAGQTMMILITNDATSGKVITFGTNFLSTGTLTGTASKSAIVGFVSDGSSWYETFRTLGL